MTITYLRGGLSACSVVWPIVSPFFLSFINFLMQLCNIFFRKSLKNTAYTFFSWSRLSFGASFRECFAVALLFNCEFWTGDETSDVFSSTFSYLTFQILKHFAKPQDWTPVGYFFYFCHSWNVVHSISSIAPP